MRNRTFARRQPLKQNKYNLNRIISSFEAVLRRAKKSSIGFDMKLDPRLPPAIVDAAQFEAVLLNLVVNAGDAMPDGGTLTLSTEPVELRSNTIEGLPAGRYAKITVRDTGTGMPPEVAKRATEPFFTTKEVGKGTGMGLSQVYGTIKQFGGDMTIETEIGKGTAISLFLPAQVFLRTAIFQSAGRFCPPGTLLASGDGIHCLYFSPIGSTSQTSNILHGATTSLHS